MFRIFNFFKYYVDERITKYILIILYVQAHEGNTICIILNIDNMLNVNNIINNNIKYKFELLFVIFFINKPFGGKSSKKC